MPSAPSATIELAASAASEIERRAPALGLLAGSYLEMLVKGGLSEVEPLILRVLRDRVDRGSAWQSPADGGGPAGGGTRDALGSGT